MHKIKNSVPTKEEKIFKDIERCSQIKIKYKTTQYETGQKELT